MWFCLGPSQWQIFLYWRHQYLPNHQCFNFCWFSFENEYAYVFIVYISGAKSHCCLKNQKKPQNKQTKKHNLLIFLLKHTRKNTHFHTIIIGDCGEGLLCFQWRIVANKFLFRKVFIGVSESGNNESRTFPLIQGMPNILFIFRSCSRSETGLFQFGYPLGFVAPKSEHTEYWYWFRRTVFSHEVWDKASTKNF